MKNIKQLLHITIFSLVFILSSCSEEGNCCKTCSAGKACGDSCISKTDTCNEGNGCACDG